MSKFERNFKDFARDPARILPHCGHCDGLGRSFLAEGGVPFFRINPIPLVKPRPCSPKPEKQGRGLTIESKVSFKKQCKILRLLRTGKTRRGG